MATFAADQSFWPPIHALFDFTLTFEDVVMGIAPASLALLSAPWVARSALREERCIRTNFLLWLKMLIAGGIFATDVATLALRRSLTDAHTHTALAATILTVFASVAISAVIYAHHLYDLQSSSLSSTYVAVTMLLDATRSRSFFLRDKVPLGAAAAVTAGLKLAMVLAEEVPKTGLILHPSPHVGRESTSGFLSRLCFLWVNPLLSYGYRHDDLAVDDIGGLGPEFAAELLHRNFGRRWRESPATSGFGLAVLCLRCTPLAFLAILLPQLCATGFAFSKPFVLQQVIAHLGSGSSSSSTSSSSSRSEAGNAVIGATTLAFVGFALTNNFGQHRSYRLLTQIRGALVTELFAKCTRLSMKEAEKISVVTLMTADIQGIAQGLSQLFLIPLSLLQAGIGMYLLSLIVSYSFVLVIVAVLASTLAGYSFGIGVSNGYARWNRIVESRVKKTSNVLSQLPSIKMQGLGPTMVKFLENERAEEMAVAKKYRVVQSWQSLVALLIDIATPPLLFAGALFWTGLQGGVNAKQVFPALAILGMVQNPLTVAMKGYSSVMVMMKSLDRIQEFFNTEEIRDQRIMGHSDLEEAGEKTKLQQESKLIELETEKQDQIGLLEDETRPPVEFANVDIAPLGQNTALLQNVSFTAKKGSLTAVVGGVGSGKSTFLHSILGEAEILQGTVTVGRDGPVGYCDQVVWLRNASIRDNIVGSSPFDQERYDRAVRICRLSADIDQFPEGDGYIIGSNGCNLSGGQRQRLSLARALFLEARLMVLDDIFSALDHPTATAIFSDLFGENGFLRRANCTVILSTHLPECLDMADQVLVFDGKGTVSVRTTLKQEKQRREILEVLRQPTAEQPSASNGSEMSAKSVLPAKPSPITGKIDFRGVSRAGLYGLFLKSMGIWQFCVFVVLQMMMSALEVLPDIYMRIWIEVAPTNNLYYIGYSSIAIVCACTGAVTVAFYFVNIAPRAAMRLHQSFSETVMSSTLSFITKTDSGSILNNFFSTATFFGVLTQIGAILASSKWMVIAVVVIIATTIVLQYYYLRTSRQVRHLELEAHTPLYTQFLEISSGLRHIRAFKWEEAILAESFKLIDSSQKPFYMLYTIQRWLSFVLDCMSTLLAIILAAIAIHIPNSTSQAAIGLGFMQVITVATTSEQTIDAWTRLETSLGSLLRVHLFNIETPLEPQETLAKLPDVWPQAGKIEFEEVTARYSPDDGDKIALRNVSFAITPGQKVGLRGRTGSGKSSVILTLLGFLEYSGRILIDDVDVSTIAPDKLRARLITISQHSVKFSGTVRNNLLPFQINEMEEEKIRERDGELQDELCRLNLWELVQEKGGLDAKLDDVGLSGGQLQMLCIARAILRHRDIGGKIVLVDEGTSNIDYETDAAIQQALKEAFADCTMITIAHRTNTIDDCDLQIELSKGEVVKKER
ncbi:hypothetical protein PWT90_07569 [Aphanocladium album]|nr:hypothetical protein PWT90_07569 [Aphanocladium album]